MPYVDYLSKEYHCLIEQVSQENAGSIIVINGGARDHKAILRDIELAATSSTQPIKERNSSIPLMTDLFADSELFKDVKERGDILLFDEADSLFGKRTEVNDAHDRYTNVEVSHLIERLTEYPGVAVLTTNQTIDKHSSLLTKVDTVICFPKTKTALRRWRSKLITFFR